MCRNKKNTQHIYIIHTHIQTYSQPKQNKYITYIISYLQKRKFIHNTKTHKHTQTHTNTHKHTQTHTNTHTHTQTHTLTYQKKNKVITPTSRASALSEGSR